MDPAFVPAGDGTVAGIHPDRLVGGSHPALGLVLEGTVTGCRPAGALWEIDLRIVSANTASAFCGRTSAERTAGVCQSSDKEVVTARLPGPASVGQPLVITATAPPVFWPGGAAIEAGRD